MWLLFSSSPHGKTSLPLFLLWSLAVHVEYKTTRYICTFVYVSTIEKLKQTF